MTDKPTSLFVIRDGERVRVEVKPEQFNLYTKTMPARAMPMNEPFVVETLEGEMTGASGDYLMMGVENELYPCAASVFASSYEQMSREDPRSLTMDLWQREVADGIANLAWATAGLPTDDPIHDKVRALDDALSEGSRAHIAWKQEVLRNGSR